MEREGIVYLLLVREICKFKIKDIKEILKKRTYIRVHRITEGIHEF